MRMDGIDDTVPELTTLDVAHQDKLLDSPLHGAFGQHALGCQPGLAGDWRPSLGLIIGHDREHEQHGAFRGCHTRNGHRRTH